MQDPLAPMSDLRYPVGKFVAPAAVTADERAAFTLQIEELPARLRAAVSGLTEPQLDTPYRPEGWRVRQVVHHLADSHLNALVRFKLALTEDEPAIKTYAEARWAELPDARSAPVEWSLALLESLHQRWVLLLRGLSEEQWSRAFRHPDHGRVGLERTLALYAWHGRHHLAHITSLREREGWA
ncbi:MAG TPA: bacillithiol transferase BstA [Vicinamibacteria bacterium]|nr:bacillithiol transferase BstA [Vicinamibacteria bacterium]